MRWWFWMTSNDYRWFSLSLRISGHGVDFAELQRELALTPTHAVREGNPVRPGSEARALKDVCVYDLVRKSDRSIREELSVAERTLGSKSEVLKRLAQRHEVTLWCSYQTNLAQSGFELEPSAIAFLNELGITFTISILSWGEANDPQ